MQHYKTQQGLVAKARKALIDPASVFRFLRSRQQDCKRVIDVTMMMCLLNIWPEQVYRFSTRKFLPSKEEKYNRHLMHTMPFEVIESRTSRDLPKIKELNLVMRGTSFDIAKLEYLSSPICFISFYPITMASTLASQNYEGHQRMQYAPIETDKDGFYAMGDSRIVRELLKLNLQVLWVEICYLDRDGKICPCDGSRQYEWYERMLDNPLCKRVSMQVRMFADASFRGQQIGSGLATIGACSFLADVINVYGWDFYLESSPSEMTYWQLFFNLYRYKLDVSRSKNHLESAMINFYYGYYLSQLTNVNVYGYMGQLSKHEKLIKRIEKVLFN